METGCGEWGIQSIVCVSGMDCVASAENFLEFCFYNGALLAHSDRVVNME